MIEKEEYEKRIEANHYIELKNQIADLERNLHDYMEDNSKGLEKLGHKITDITLGNTAKIINQNKIIADYNELKELIIHSMHEGACAKLMEELKEQIKQNRLVNIQNGHDNTWLKNQNKNLESVLKDSQKEFHEIITLIAKDEWDSETSHKLRHHRDRIRSIFKKLCGEKEISNLSDLGLNPRNSHEDRDRVVDSKPAEPFKCAKCGVEISEKDRKLYDSWHSCGGQIFTLKQYKNISEEKPAEPKYSKCRNLDRILCRERECPCEDFQSTYDPKSYAPNDDKLMEMANIEQIIEVYDNGHEKIFEPESYHYYINQELIAEFNKDFHNTCEKCSNKPFDSPQCVVFLEGCLIYSLRKKWEQRQKQ